MSAFKRFQSKVFWGQMESLDLAGASASPLPEQESSESSRDTTNDANVTVVLSQRSLEAQNFERSQSFQGISRDESASVSMQDTTEVESKSRRTCSPASQGHRSQDSGFSDSDRSECSDKDDAETSRGSSPKRERRHKQPRIQNPVHTSTPKQPSDRKISLGHNEANIAGARWDLRKLDGVENQVSSSTEDDALGDFLYSSEPPEDEDASSWSRSQGTPSVRSLRDETSRSDDYLDPKFGYLAPVRAWLGDIATDVGEECSVALQSKTLPKRNALKLPSSHNLDLKILTSSSTSAATKLLVRAETFDKHYRAVCEQLLRLENVRLESKLLQSIEEDAFGFLSELGAPPPRRIHQGNLRSIVAQLENLKIEIDRTLEPRLDFYIERVVRSLEEAPVEDGSVARGAIATLTALGLAGSRAGSSIARCAGVRALLTSLVSSLRLCSNLRAASLRALSSVCSCPEAIESFVKEDGPEILADILADGNCPESERTEAAALVVQITAPWTNALGLPHLVPFADSLVRDLTQLAQETSCSQTLLLTAAALNNLSSSKKFVVAIVEHDALRRLVQGVKKFSGGNVWLMEQVASLIGEVARVPEARRYLAGARVCVALVSFLRMRPPGLEVAYRRLEETAKAALTRLCVDPEIAKQVVAVSGTDCLEEICSDDEGNLKYTRSLRIASKKAAEQIHAARDLL